MKYPIAAIIFAGGKSSRMGKDKALLPFANYDTLTQYQYHSLSSIFEKVYISAKEEKFNFDTHVIIDNYKEFSPLSGIISLFETLHADEFFILSVDTPFVDKKVIESLLKASDNRKDATIAKSPSGIQPLCGVYRRSILALARINFTKGNHKLNSLLKEADTQFVSFETDSSFENLNYLHEYEHALKRFI